MDAKFRLNLRRLAVLALAGAAVTPGARAQRASSPPVDVVLALDNSGSMKQNDPDRLMKQAVLDFPSHLTRDSQVGLILFGQQANVVLGLTRVSDPSFHSRLSEALKRLDYSEKWTDIPGGIERAIYTLNHTGRPNARHVVIFFTDGIIETGNRSRDLQRGQWLRQDLAAEARQRGIRIYGIAFTEAADYELIQSVAQTTGGSYYRVLKPSDIADAFTRIGKRIEAPLPASAPQARPGASETAGQLASSSGRMLLGGAIVLILLAGVAVVLVRRGPGEASEKVPPADFAHLMDIGRYTGSDRVLLRKRRVRIGRDTKVNDVRIPKDTVSSQHATIEYRESGFYLRDLRSSNGTFVNGKQISDPEAVREVMLKPGDRIRFDAYEFVFNLDALAEGAGPGAAEVPTGGGTVLRKELPPLKPRQPGPEAGKPVGATPLGGSSPGDFPGRKGERPSGGPAETWVRLEFCPAHPAWKATELCPKCGRGKCKQCMTERDGQPICVDCAHQAGA